MRHLDLVLASCASLLALGCTETTDNTCGKGLSESRCGGVQCQVAATTPVAWTAETALGSPAARFATFAGACQAPFSWDGQAWAGTVVVTPMRGQSVLSTTVAIDTASARLVTYTGQPCPDTLMVDGTVTLALPEGMVAEARPFTLSASALSSPKTLGFVLPEASFGPWVALQKLQPNATLAMSFDISAVGQACSGRAQLSYDIRTGNSGEGGGGPFAAWSDSGCDVGQAAANLAEPYQGVDLAAAIATTFGQATLSGVWNNGEATTLSLTTTLPTTAVCAETLPYGTVVSIPVDVVASTADGRVRGLGGRANVRATLNQAGLSELQLWLSTDLACASAGDTLAYTPASCATVSKLTAQLSYNRYSNGSSPNGGRLEIYGASEGVVRLELGP